MKSHSLLLIAASVVLLTGGSAAAGEAAGQPAGQQATEVSCFEDLGTKLELGGDVVPSGTSTGNWKTGTQQSSLRPDRVTHIACLPATEFVWGTFKSGLPSLFIMCALPNLEMAFVAVGDDLGEGALRVTAHVDGTESVEGWNVARDAKSLIAPTRAREFARDTLMPHKELVLEFAPRGGESVGFRFELSGAADALKILSDACKWE